MGQHTHISVAILAQAVLDQTINPIFLYIIRQWTIATVRFFVVTSKVNDLSTMNTTFPFLAKLQHWNLVQFVSEYALQWEQHIAVNRQICRTRQISWWSPREFFLLGAVKMILVVSRRFRKMHDVRRRHGSSCWWGTLPVQPSEASHVAAWIWWLARCMTQRTSLTGGFTSSQWNRVALKAGGHWKWQSAA